MDAVTATSNQEPDDQRRASATDSISWLEALGEELSSYGWAARVHAPSGKPPSLYARNPEPGAAALSEHIYARPQADGTWTYWWPWDEPIADEPATTAAIITRVLRPAERGLGPPRPARHARSLAQAASAVSPVNAAHSAV